MASFLANLVIPLNLSVTLLLLALLLLIVRWRKMAGLLAVSALVWAFFWSLPSSSLWAGGMLEQRFPYHEPASQPVSQAIVVLGGNTANGRKNWFEPYQRDNVIMRTDTAGDLYLAGRAPLLVVSGAALDGGQSEASMMAAALERMGVPATAIIQEGNSYTTHQNAVYTARLLKENNISEFLLVTSALHMPRAMASFRKQGFRPVAAPSPAQIVVPRGQAHFSFWLPDLRTLHASRSIVKEYLGLLVYWLRGWA